MLSFEKLTLPVSSTMIAAFLLTYCALKCVYSYECYYSYKTHNFDMHCIKGMKFKVNNNTDTYLYTPCRQAVNCPLYQDNNMGMMVQADNQYHECTAIANWNASYQGTAVYNSTDNGLI